MHLMHLCKQPQCAPPTHHTRTLHARPPARPPARSFSVPYETKLGQELRVVGSCKELGAWQLNHAMDLRWTPGHVWHGEVDLPDTPFEFKARGPRAAC